MAALWKVTLTGVADVDTMLHKIENSLFFVRCGEPKSVAAVQNEVVVTVPQDRSRSAMTKVCCQTFRLYGTFANHTIEEVQHVSSGTSWV